MVLFGADVVLLCCGSGALVGLFHGSLVFLSCGAVLQAALVLLWAGLVLFYKLLCGHSVVDLLGFWCCSAGCCDVALGLFGAVLWLLWGSLVLMWGCCIAFL